MRAGRAGRWSGGKVGSGTYFGHMELDEFKSKLPEEMARIKALLDSSKQSNKKQKVSSVESSVELLVASGAKTGTLTIGGQSVSFMVAAASTSTLPANASQAKSGTDKKESWLSDEYKEARSKSASAQFGSKGLKQPAAPKLVEDDCKPAVLETAPVTQTVSSASTMDDPIPKKLGKGAAAAKPVSEATLT